MKKLFLIIGLIILLLSCAKQRQKYIITGSLPSQKYNGMKIFLVPAVGDNPSNVDSVTIMKGKFIFVGDTERVSIIRMPMKVRYNFQDLLVVTEKGKTKVVIDSISSGCGTPQNDLLQQWKSKVMKMNTAVSEYYIAKDKKVSKTELDKLEMKKDSARKVVDNFTLKIIRSNQGSTLSKFLSRLTGKK